MNIIMQEPLKLRIWWIPQIPMEPFQVPVHSLREARLLLNTLADYDQYQLDKNIKPDYCNAGGLHAFNQDGDNEWAEWYCELDDEYCDDFQDLTDDQVDQLDRRFGYIRDSLILFNGQHYD